MFQGSIARVVAKLRRNRRAMWAGGAFCAALCPSLADADTMSPWVESAHSAVRLISAGEARPEDGLPPGTRLAGVEVRLDPNFITYWRSPGDAGVPPAFGFDGSVNLKAVRVEYPAPEKLDEGGSEAFGYSGAATFPLVIAAEDPAKPVRLNLAFDYATCANICLPASAKVSLDLGTSSGPEAGIVFDAMGRVPVERKLGQPGPVRIDAFRRQPDGTYAVEATTPDGAGTLFVEAPQPSFMSASASRAGDGGHVSFTISAPEPATASLPGEPVRLTLVNQAGAIEVPVRLDAATPKP